MGKKSVKENKNTYQNSRESAGLTRQQASEQMEFISADRIEKIENERTEPHPEEILAMSKCYKDASLCNYFCSHKCPIGKEYVPEVELKDLTQITLEVLSTLNSLEKEKDRFIEIAADSRIAEDEIPDFLNIKKKLEQISLTADSLRLWIEHSVAKGEMGKLE
ncbi:MAG: helix-turn-helix transcriptional regulator [Lachnospiraceae bacterium]|nr:helix-turn-helix transcriptional regulator [Lachnospiraceae bacterium]